jgi:beta-N-acetylhexosaminidase
MTPSYRPYLGGSVLVVVAAAMFALGVGLSRAFFATSADEVAPMEVQQSPPTPSASPVPTPLILQMPLSVKVGQLIMAGFAGTTSEGVAELIARYHLGNVVLVGANIGSPADVLALTTELQHQASDENGEGLLIAIDQEGGRVKRLPPPWVQFPPAREIGCIGAQEFARRAGEVVGDELLAVGINVDLAPVADVVDNPANTVIGDRAFGTTPDAVTAMLPAYVGGLAASGVASTAKHFPGHGSTTGDSHDGPVVLEKSREQLETTQLAPFRSIAKMADLFMMANVDVPALDDSGVPAGLSSATVRFLRDAVGFHGVVITDSLAMGAIQERWSTGQAAVMALAAGVDIVLTSSGADVGLIHDEIMSALRDGRLSESRVDEALGRVIALKRRLIKEELPPIAEVGSSEHQAFVGYLQLAAERAGCAF